MSGNGPYGVWGTGINAPPAVLAGTMAALTEKRLQNFLADQVLRPSGTFWAMNRRGKQFRSSELVYPLLTVEEPTGGAYVGTQLLNTSVTDSIQPANQLWRDYYQSLSLPITDLIRNSGSGLDMVGMKVEAMSGSFLQKLNRALWHTAPQNTVNDIDDIESWIGSGTPATPNSGSAATNTIAGIDRSQAANSWWVPPTPQNGGGTALTAANAELAIAAVRYSYDTPDLMVMDRTRYANFKNQFIGSANVSLIRWTGTEVDNEAVQAGIRNHFLFDNCVVLDDPFVPASVAYVINTKYLYPVYHSSNYFRVVPWLRPTNQDVIVSGSYLTWQLQCTGPRMGIKVWNLL